MKCPGCEHNIPEQNPNFCSNCGQKLSSQPALPPDADAPEKNEESPKRQNEDPHPKRKRKRKKKKKKNDTDQSDPPLTDDPKDTREGADSDPKDTRHREGADSDPKDTRHREGADSDPKDTRHREGADSCGEGTPGSADVPQEKAEAPERSTEGSIPPAEPTKGAKVGPTAPGHRPAGVFDGKAVKDERAQTDPTQAPVPPPGSEQSTQSDDQSHDRTIENSSKNQKNSSCQSQLDRSATGQTEATPGKKKQLPPSEAAKDDANGNQSAADDGSAPPEAPNTTGNRNAEKQSKRSKKKSKKTPGDAQMQRPAHGTAPETPQPSSGEGAQDEKRTNEKNAQNKKEPDSKRQKLDQNANEKQNKKQSEPNKEEKKKPEQTQSKNANQKMFFGQQETQSSGSSVDPIPEENLEPQTSEGPGSNKHRPIRAVTVAPRDGLTVCFYALLSKDFQFNPEEDQISVRAGKCLGTWKDNLAEFRVLRALGEHGLLVEGTLTAPKSRVCEVHVPYKYVVCKGDRKAVFECRSSNRSLFVKPALLNKDGEWHQYDDVIFAPPTNKIKRMFSFWSDHKKRLLQGREVAGKILLEMIVERLQSWSHQHLRSFLSELKCFFQVYSSVFEERENKRQRVDYGPEEVRELLKDFLLNAVPQFEKHERAILTLHAQKEFEIPLNAEELCALCRLLCLPRLSKEDFLQFWTTVSTQVRLFQTLPDLLLSLMNAVLKEGRPHWILVLPTLHLLRGNAQPFELALSGDVNHLPSWAGLEGVWTNALNSQHRKAAQNLLRDHAHLLEVDTLLVRSFVLLMPLEETLECVDFVKPELLLLLQILILNHSPLEIRRALVAHITHRLTEGTFRVFSEEYGRECLNAAVTVLYSICNMVRPTAHNAQELPVPVVCMNLVASVWDLVFSQLPQEKREVQFLKDAVLSALNVSRRWISPSFCFTNRGLSSLCPVQRSRDVHIWNSALSVQFRDDRCTAEWRETLLKDFEDVFNKEHPLDRIQFYVTNFDQVCSSHQRLASSVEKSALEAVAHLCQNKCENKLFERIKINVKFHKLFSAVIEKSWPSHCEGAAVEEEVLLKHLLSWSAAQHIFPLYVAEKELSRALSADANEKLVVARSFCSAVVKRLLSGNIQIRLLSVILHNQIPFLLLIKKVCETEPFWDEAQLKKLLLQREREVRAVKHEKELLDILVKTSRDLEDFLKVDLEELEEKHQLDVEEMHLDDFLELRLFDGKLWDKGVGFFELDPDLRDMAQKMLSFRESRVFRECWQRHVRAFVEDKERSDDEEQEEEHSDDEEREEECFDNEEEGVSLQRVCEEIFVPCLEEFEEIYGSLKSGSMSLEKVSALFADQRGEYGAMTRDLEVVTRDLETMCSLDPSDDKRWVGARVQQIRQFRELRLAVASAEIIVEVRACLCLQGDFSILENLLRLKPENLKKMQINQINRELIKAKEELAEISESRRESLRELVQQGPFVRWVTGALEDVKQLKVFVDLASISAGENDMDVDRVACFHDAVLGYSPVLYELQRESDFHHFKRVLQKLWRALENDRNLPQKLRDSARHVEWLKTVKDSHGSVELSSLALASSVNKKGVYVIGAPSGGKLRLDEALRLQIPEEHEEGPQRRTYSLEDLRELQNKLMLMSGKEHQGQQEVERFTEVFDSVQRLLKAFMALHTAGNPLFRHWEAQIRCSTNAHEPSITMDFHLGGAFGSLHIQGSLEDLLPDLCRKIETCLKFWMDFVSKQRWQHYYLNYYTSEQIVYLCSHLSQRALSRRDEQALMMLSLVQPDVSAAHLRRAWHQLQYHILTQPEEQNEDIEFQTFTMEPSLIQSGLQEFEVKWNTYMKDMKGSLPDVLDLKTLGQLLEILAKEVTESESDEDVTTCVYRKLPNGLNVGKPNLVVCPHEDILTSCISTYMSSKEESLPTHDEVLLCTSTMPYEQVELFLRRCLSRGYEGHKVYSLLYADVLTYDVSAKVESVFHHLKMQSRSDYRLVIFCSSEREHAYLPSAFSQYKVHMVPQAPLVKIQEYLHDHYVVPELHWSAAAAFKRSLCVGVVSSRRAGVGKSLYIKRLFQKLKQSSRNAGVMKCIRLIEPTVDEDAVLQSLLNFAGKKALFHLDVSSSVQRGLHEFLFKLLFLRCLVDSGGQVWKCSETQLYVVEILEPTKAQKSSFTDVFPKIFCRPPKEVLEMELRKTDDPTILSAEDPLMDDEEFRSAAFQRTYQYLRRFYINADLDRFRYRGVEGSHGECLQMLLMFCGIMDPSWAELRNFAWFLNLQLQDCETSAFCDAAFSGDTLVGFKRFVVDFMILMAKDFATPSLSISDQSPGRPQVDLTGVREEDLVPFLIRKRWETEPHPYIFFNDDHMSMTFIGFHLQLNDHSVDAIDPASGRVIKRRVMSKQLYNGLTLQRMPFNINFDRLPRREKIERMCKVLGIPEPLDPDETYELTTDNILKILAIHMRFRCGIPVILMGETGCGKTRLIKFLCELRKGGVAAQNMKLVKVHGGTTSNMIYAKVREAESMAATNKKEFGFDSILFLDEANTTEAISSIKEVLCDQTVQGEALTSAGGLQIIAACNPYRKHTDEMIERLESAGLGYRVRAEETDEKLGSIPLRQLVYRVHALPPSMIPLVWDFGQLNDDTEKIYIRQIVQRVVQRHPIRTIYAEVIVNVLSVSQRFMRRRNDECSFVSLRDVERCMQAFVWFFNNHVMFFDEMDKFDSNQSSEDRDAVLWSLVMATGLCYHACLENKETYREEVSRRLPQYTSDEIKQDITLMQDLLLNGVPLRDTIARNNALKENFFMMVICIELQIPLFLVGKPGSSKSLSKTLVADAMQGQAAHSDIYKRLKQVHLVSFQCSPHSTPEGIINTFKQCGRFQEGKNLQEYVSVVVLDEIGLAEDSPKMPLKTLHPLLEEGCIDDAPLPHKKVGFIGISNWALDPAKMNRGIFVSRGDPDEKELVESAAGICSSDNTSLEMVRGFFKPLAAAYFEICQQQANGFFGLRDYYSLIKMIFAIAKKFQRKPSAEELMKAVLRNFSGRVDVETVSIFRSKLQITPDLENISAIEFVKENIQAIGRDEECRYLLVLTKNYAALQILQQTFFKESIHPEIIFGSSFPKDQEYTQICRNINRVKICMETGQTVVLLNLQNLYESLYDALNQYYVFFGGQKYVDLGLGTHRVKCRVHNDFRLIVIEEREVVYKEFPIPLINRLEKHFLDLHTLLKAEQKAVVEELEKWVELFVSLRRPQGVRTHEYKAAEVFIGFHSDTCASVVLHVLENHNAATDLMDKRVLDEAKLVLLRCATPDSVVRLDCTDLPKGEIEHLAKVYSEEQKNGCLCEFVRAHVREERLGNAFFTEVTTFSRLLTTSDLNSLEQNGFGAALLSVQQFDTELSFLKQIRNFLRADESNIKILLIQCDFDEASHSANLVASAKYSSINEIRKSVQENPGLRVFVYFITRLPRTAGGTSYVGFHGGPWRSVHIDDLRRTNEMVSDIKILQGMTFSQLFETDTSRPEALETDKDMYLEKESMESKESPNPDGGSVLDTTLLLQSCVQSAVGMLRDQQDSGLRSTRRVDILLTLLHDDDRDEIKEGFNTIIKRHLHVLLAARVDSTLLSIRNNWVMREASNIDALQEGGTFRNTLWKRVQAVVVPMLAHLIAISDRDQNLDLLLDTNCGPSLKRLWLDIFTDDTFLQIPQLSQDRSSESRTVLIQNYISPKLSVGCSMPFSWRIRDFLEDMWVHAVQHEGQTQLQFDDFFWTTSLGLCIGKADQDTQTEVYHRYLQDFVSLSLNVSCEAEMQLLSAALNTCVNELKIKLGATDHRLSVSWIHSAYHQFHHRLQNLSRIICLQPQVTRDLLRNASSREGSEMILDVFAAFACVERLEPGLLDSDAQRQMWLRQVHKLQVPVELVCSEDSVRFYGARSRTLVSRVQDGWNRIFCLSLFVEHLLVGVEELEQRLVPVLLEHTQRLGQILERNSDLKTAEAFEKVIASLKSCKEGAVESIFRFGLPWCSVCIGDPEDPICLPCQHIFCLRCIRQWLRGQMSCPCCVRPVPQDFAAVPSEAIRVKIKTHVQFRRRCNAFFVELVSSMCFRGNSPPSPEVIHDLLSFLMHEANAAPSPGAQRGRQIVTKEFSPFAESLDQSPVVRSVVLKLLLKYSFDQIKEFLKHHLRVVEESQLLDDSEKTELYLLYINCFEDSMFEKLSLQEESGFLKDLLTVDSRVLDSASVECLQLVARVRLDLDLAAALLVEEPTETPERQAAAVFLERVQNLCTQSKNNWYRIYLIRKIGSGHGVEYVQNLLKVQHMRWLFPEEVLQETEETPMDLFLVCGPDYQTIRNAVGKVVLNGTVDGLDETCERCTCVPQRKAVFLLLALFREVTTWYRQRSRRLHPTPHQIKLWRDYFGTSKVLTSPAQRAFAQALVMNELGPLTLRPGLCRTQCVLTELTVHLTAVLHCGPQHILGPLQQLALAPGTMQAAFLPSMPEDKVTMAQRAMGPRLQWYKCLNGHPCAIGECGRPVETSRCLDCGAQIGGTKHRPAQGFQQTHAQPDRSQRGHVLGEPRRRGSPDLMDTKSLSPVPFALVRMFMHMALLSGAWQDKEMISSIIRPQVPDPGEFLRAHLKEDHKHLTKALGKGADDIVSSVHLILCRLLQPPQRQTWPVGYDNLLSTNEARNNWETEMSNIITPQLKELDKRLKEVNTFIRSDERLSASAIMKLMFGDPGGADPGGADPGGPENRVLHCSSVWSCRQKVTLTGLAHTLEQKHDKDTLPFLWNFLHREAEYRMVKFLPEILTLQKNLVKKFQNVAELCGTVSEYLESLRSISQKSWYEKHIQIFFSTWNQLRVFLETNGEIRLPPASCHSDLDLSCDFRLLLPSRRGPGLLSTALVSYLIALHNALVHGVEKLAGEETSYRVSPADVTDLHVVRYELDRDLMPLVLSNTHYSTVKGQDAALHDFDLPRIQQQIVSRFVSGKPLITLNGIPTLLNRHERNYEVLLKDVKERIRQEPLPNRSQSFLTSELNSYSELCEALSTLEVALGFLSRTGGDPCTPLSRYLEAELKMAAQTPPHVLQALGRFSLKHCVSLWQLLGSLRSQGLLKLNRDPFGDVSEEYKKELGADERRLLTAFVSKHRADSYLLEMHEFLVLELNKPSAPDTFRPEWNLKVTLVSFMERKDTDVPEVDLMFPDDICLCHYVEAWKFCVGLKQERAFRP